MLLLLPLLLLCCCSKRPSIIYMLLDVLSTPSEAVQRAVSNCLPRLVQPLAGDKEFIQVSARQRQHGEQTAGSKTRMLPMLLLAEQSTGMSQGRAWGPARLQRARSTLGLVQCAPRVAVGPAAMAWFAEQLWPVLRFKMTMVSDTCLMLCPSPTKLLLQGLLDRLLTEIKSGGPGGYGLRRGAAYGVSGIVKGLGIASLKGFGVLESLKSMVENKKDAEGREGSLQAFECLCEKLGRLFEPYVIHILPLLLQCFGDSSPQVGHNTYPMRPDRILPQLQNASCALYAACLAHAESCCCTCLNVGPFLANAQGSSCLAHQAAGACISRPLTHGFDAFFCRLPAYSCAGPCCC